MDNSRERRGGRLVCWRQRWPGLREGFFICTCRTAVWLWYQLLTEGLRVCLDRLLSRLLNSQRGAFMRSLPLILCLALAGAVSGVADEGHHHEDLTQEQLGTVHFPVTCSTDSQKSFEKGVALLHSFWYEESEKAFQEIEKQDPKCAMAYWGEGMSSWHQLWGHPDAKTVKKEYAALKKAEKLHAET